MGLLRQLGLLLRKNLKLRIRSPALTLTQLLWPVVLFVVIALVRTRFQPQKNLNCYYDAKAMPSRGLVPFMQSFVCDLSTSCMSSENGTRTGNDLPAYHAEARIAQIANSLDPIFSNGATVESLKKLPDAIKPLAELSNGLSIDALTNFTEQKYQLTDFFRNVSNVRDYLLKEGELDAMVVDALLDAELDVYQLLQVTGFIDFKGTVCNATRLNEVLTFPDGVDVGSVSKALCEVEDDKIPVIVDELQTQLDIPYLIDEFSQFLQALGQSDWSSLLDNASTLLRQLESIGNMGDFVQGLPNLLEIVKLVPTVQELFKQLEQGTLQRQLEIVLRLTERIDAQLVNATWWADLKSIISRGHSVFSMVTSYLDHLQENVIPIKSLFRNVTIIQGLLEHQYNLTRADVEAILQLHLKQNKIADLLQNLANGDNLVDLFCSPGRHNISEFVIVPRGNIHSSMESVQEILCNHSSNGGRLLQLLFNSTDLLLLFDQVEQVLNRPPPALQWEALLNDIVALSASLEDLPDFVQQLPAFLENLPQLLGNFEQLAIPPFNWNQLLGSLQGDMSIETALTQSTLAPFLSVMQDVLSQTPVWPEIEYQLIIQHMTLDIYLDVLNMFTGGSCPDGWHSSDLSCYKYIHEVTPDLESADKGCKQIHHRSHLVTVNHAAEQKFIESIGENTISWLGLVSYGTDYVFWIGDGTLAGYQNWIATSPTEEPVDGTSPGHMSCGIANFGTDGLWHHVGCNMPAESYICEVLQDHKLVQLLKEEPVNEITKVLLDLGPSVTESIIRSFLNSTYIQMLFKMAPSEQAMALCAVDLATLPPSIDQEVVRQKLCSLNLTRILAEQMQYWQIPALESKINDLLAFLEIDPASIPAEYSHLANLSAIVQKQNLNSQAWGDVFARPFDPQSILEELGYTDSQAQDWEDMFSRVLQSLNSMTMQQISDASIMELVEALDMQFGGSSIWTVAKEIIITGQNVLTAWVKQGDQGQAIVFQSLFRNESILKGIFKNQLNLSVEDTQAILLASINMDKIPELLPHLIQDPSNFLCSSQFNITDFLIFPMNTTNVRGLTGSVQTALCYVGHKDINATTFLTTLLQELDWLMLVDQLGSSDNWDHFLQELAEISSNTQDLSSFFQIFLSMVNASQLPLNFSSNWNVPYDWFLGNLTVAEVLGHPGIMDLLGTLDMQFVGSPVWTVVKEAIFTGHSVLGTLLEHVDKYQGQDISLESFFHEESIFRHIFQNQLNLTAEQVQALQQSSINMDKVVELLVHIASTQQDPVSLFCTGQFNITDYLITMGDAATARDLADSLQTALCYIADRSMNSSTLLTTLLDELDLTALADQLRYEFHHGAGNGDWDLLLQELVNITRGIQNLPSFVQTLPDLINIFQQPLNASSDWSGIISWLSDNETFLEALNQLSSGFYPSLAERYLAETEFWPVLQEQLIVQNLMLDIQLSVVNLFTGGTCDEGWLSNDVYCYHYVNEVSDWFGAYQGCQNRHPMSSLVSVDSQEEQLYLQSIGHDEESWLGLFAYWPLPVHVWSGSVYENWAPESQQSTGSFLCAKANFGTDGLWYQANCSVPLESYICERIQDHILTQHLKKQPFVNVTKTFLELGPNVTESLIRAFLNFTKLEMLLNMTQEEQLGVLCNEDFVTLYPPSTSAKEKLCSLDLFGIFQEQSAYWNVADIQTKVSKLQAFLTRPIATTIPPEYTHYASLEEVLQKQQLFTLLVEDAFKRPFHPTTLWEGSDVAVTGSDTEWQEMFIRIATLSNEELMAQWMDMATGMNGSLISSLPQYNTAILQLADTTLQAINRLFTIIQEFAVGKVFSGAMPETQRFLQGFMELINEGPMILSALAETLNDQSKVANLVSATDVRAVFCNDTLRRSLLSDSHSINTTALDDYLCVLNYDILLEELRVVVSFDEILSQIMTFQTESFTSTTSSTMITANFMSNVETLIHNFNALPDTIASFTNRYNVSSFGSIAEALFNAMWMGFENITLTNENNGINLEGILLQVPELQMVLDTLSAYEAVDLAQLHAYITFLNQYLDQAKENSCRDGWQKHDFSCYKYVNERSSYWAAYHGCRAQHWQSNIITIDDQDEQMFLQSFGPNTDVWLDYFAFGYQNFAPSSYNGTTGCVRANFGANGSWYRANCSSFYSFICEAVPELNLTLRLLHPFTNDTSIRYVIAALEQALGPAMVTQILEAPLNPYQLGHLVSASDWQEALCRESFLRELFVSPDSFNVTRLGEVLCSGAVMDAINSLYNGTSVFDQFFNMIESLSGMEFNSTSLIQDTQKLFDHFASFDKYSVSSYNLFSSVMAFNQTALEEVWNLDILLTSFDVLDMTLINESWFRAAIQELSAVAYFTEHFSDRILVLKGQYLVLPDIRNLLLNVTETERLFETVANFSPELVDLILHLSVQPYKLEQFLSLPQPLQTLCDAGDFNSYFRLPVNASTDLMALEGALCSLNLTQVELELKQVLAIDSFMYEYLSHVNISSSDTLSALGSKFIALYERSYAFLQDPFSISINETWFQDKFEEVVEVLQAWSINEASTLYSNEQTSVLEMLQRLEAEFRNESWWGEVEGAVRELTSIIEYANMELRPLPGRSITFFELFPPVTADLLKQLMNNHSDIISVLSQSSVNVAKLVSLTAPADLFDLVCDNATGLGEILVFQPGVNATTVNSVLCSFDYTLLVEEWSEEINRFEEQRHLPLNWTASYESILTLIETLTNLNQSLPLLDIYDADWFREKLMETQAILESLVPSSQYMSVEDVYNMLLFWNNAVPGQYLESFIIQVRLENYINKFLTEQLQMFIGQNFTFPRLKGLLSDAEELRSVFALWDIAPDIFDAFLSLGIQPQMWLSFWQMSDPFATICSSDQFASFFELTSNHSNLTAVQQAVCSINFTLIPVELSQLYNISKIQTDFELIYNNDPSLEPFNLTSWMSNRVLVSEAFEKLIMLPPAFTVDTVWWNETQSRLQEVLNGWLMEVQQMATADQMDGAQKLLQELQAVLQSAGVWDIVRPYLEIFTLGLEGTAEQLHQQVDTLRDLLNSSMSMDSLVASLSVTPDQLQASLATSAFSVYELALIHNQGTWQHVFCNLTTFTAKFPLPPAVKSSAVQQAMCMLNQTEFFGQVSDLYGIDILRLQPQLARIFGLPGSSPVDEFDWSHLLHYTQELSSLLTELQNIPGYLRGDGVQSLTYQLENLLRDVQQRNTLLIVQVLEDIRPYFEDDSVVIQIRDSFQTSLDLANIIDSFSAVDALELIEKELQRMRLWHHVRPFLDMANVLLDGINMGMRPGGTANPQSWYNVTQLHGVLQAALDIVSPELAQAIVVERFYPISLLAYLHLSNTWEENFCTPYEIDDGLPLEINGTALRQQLCHLDRMDFFRMLDNATGVNVLHLQQLIFEVANILPPSSNNTQQQFDWDVLVGNVESVITTLQGIMGLPGPGSHDSIGEAVVLLEELQQGLTQFNLKLSIEILEQLDVLMNQQGVWSEIQGYVATVTDIAHLLNQQLEFFADTNYTMAGIIHAAAPELLAQFLAPEHVQALLSASIDPALLGVLAQPEELTLILCDASQFNSFISLPQDADVGAIQGILCSLALTNETFLQDLMAVFNIGRLQQEIQKLLMGTVTPNGVTDINWHQTLEDLQLFVTNLMSVPVGHDFLGDFFSQWLALSLPMENVPPALANLTMDYTSLCQSLSPALLNTTIWQTILHPTLASANLYMQIVDDLVFALPSHQQQLQTLVNNMTVVVELLSVLTEVQESLVESGIAVLFDSEKLSLTSNLALSLLQGDLPESALCDEELLRLTTGIPDVINITDITTLLCGVQKVLHTEGSQHILRIVGFDEIMAKITAVLSGNPEYYEPFNCPMVIMSSQAFIEKLMTLPSDYAQFFNSFERPEYFDLIDVLPQIVRNTTSEEMQSLTELYHLLQPFIGLVLNTNTTYLDTLLPYLEMIDSYVISQLDNTQFVELSSLWSNTSIVRQYLSAIEGFNTYIIEAIVNNQLNTSALAELQGNVAEQLCSDQMLFSELFVFNDTAMAIEIHELVCRNLVNSTNVLDVLTGSINITELVSTITMTGPMVITFPEYVNELLVALEDFAALDPAILDGFITEQLPLLMDGITNTTEIVQLAMNAMDLINVANSLQPVIEILQPVLKDDPTFQMVQGLLDSLNGFTGLFDLISKLPDLSLSKLFIDPREFTQFLVMDIGFSQQVASDLLSASLSLDVAASANFSAVSGIVCDEDELTKIITFPPKTNVSGILDTLCSLDSQQLAVILDGVVQRLNISSLIQEVLSFSLEERFGNITSSLGDLSKAVEDLKPIQMSLPEIMADLGMLNLSSIPVQDIVDSLMGVSSAQVSSPAPSTWQEMVCGEGASISLLPLDALDMVSSRRRRSVGSSRSKREEDFDAVEGSTPFCTSLYEAIQGGTHGRLIWAYIKPILLGKIPYAPDNSATAKIVEESNFFFEEIKTMREIAEAWLKSSKDLSKLAGSEQASTMEKFLMNSYIKEFLQAQLGLDPDSIISLLSSDLTSIRAVDLQQLDLMAQLILNLTDCVELDRFVPSRTEGALQSLAKRYSRNNTLLAGVYFSNLQGAEGLPPHVQYKIRVDIENTPKTDRLRDKYWAAGANNDLLTEQIYARGFIFIQDMIERGIISSQTNTDVEKPGVYVQLMPYPCHTVDEFVERIGYLLPAIMTLVFIGALAAMTHQLVYEKERGIEELMKAMGLRSGLNLFSWFLSNLSLMLILCAVIVLITKVGFILPSSDWSLLLVFLLCFSFSLIMMCYLISTLFQTAHIASLAVVLIYLLTYVPYVAFVISEMTLETFHQNALLCLVSTCAFTLASNEIALKEAQSIGVQWDAFAEGFNQFDEFGFNWMCVAMLWDGLLYFVIGWYISSVFPGRHGVPKPWYFIFLPWHWCNCFACKLPGSNKDMYASSDKKNPDVEMDPANVPLGISIVGLTKKYSRKKKAVDNLTLNFYENQITSFLGRNGAGKTTTISIIMGLFPATAGKVFIYGKDVMQRLHSVRKVLGVCPQHNALYDQLTVREHLEMFGRLKGMSLKDIFQQSEDLINDVGLEDAANEKVCNLSGGMKRKLSILIAFLGGSNIVILDEPTSGVDPHARRSIWDLIVKNKKGRTILLCTHFMDEADILGDRIAILDQGQLRCCGSSAFLKNQFTNGYTLTIVKDLPSNQSTPVNKRKSDNEEDLNQNRAVKNIYVDMADLKEVDAAEEAASTSSQDSSSGVSSLTLQFDTNKVTSLIQSHLPSAVFKEDKGTEVSYILPVSDGQTARFQALFHDLDASLPDLHASSYGIADATLEEVFLKVSSPVDGSVDNVKDATKMVPESTLKRTKKVYNMKPTTLRQFAAILTKRFHYTKRDWWGLVWGLLIPTLWLLLAVVFSTIEMEKTYPALHFAPSLYRPDDYVFFSNSDSQTLDGERMTNALFSEPGLGTTCMAAFEDTSSCSFVESFFAEPISSLTDAERQDILETDRKAPSCSCASSFLECPAGAAGVNPPEWTMNTTDILQDLSLKVDLNEYLLRSTKDFRFHRYNGLTFHTVKNSDGETEEIVKAWYNNKGHHAMPIALNTANNVILRSFLPAGQDPAEYGISAYNHPFQFSKEELSTLDLWEQATKYFGICLLVVVAFCLIPSTFATFLVMEYNGGSKRLHYMSGVTPIGYWLANLTWDMVLYFVPIGISLIIVYAFGMQAFGSATNMPAFCLLLFMYGFAITCQMYLLVPLFKTTGTAFVVFFCCTLLTAVLTIIPKFLQESPLDVDGNHVAFFYIDKVLLIFSPYCLASGLIDLFYNQVEADIYAKFDFDTYRDPFSYEMLGWKLIALAAEGLVAFVLLMLIEYTCRFQCGDCKSRSNDHPGLEDEDVASEKIRVASGEANRDLVCIKNLTKVYRSASNPSLVAVDNMSVGVPKGECFGLLGVNGAGKTTTFRMITNDLVPTHGTINVNSNSIGYCPQVDALYNPLTGTELLYCYAKIKGITGKQCRMAVKSVSYQMGMQKYVDNRIGTYSGGMKRSLSTAIALLGNPQVVLMDEPTTGMDPVTKQAVWCNILAMIKNGHSVILTSHSMEECELLCTRLAIMVNGRFHCLGSPQHVKHRHGDGYTLILRISEETSDMKTVMSFVNKKFPDAHLKERHHNIVRYQLPMTARKLADIFGILEDGKAHLGIQEYSVTQTTLDQVFVNFAKRQTDGHRDAQESAQEYANSAFSSADETDVNLQFV